MKKQKVAVAMSGGVDSSLAAALLIKFGYDVIGVTMNLKNNISTEIEDAKNVADFLSIPHYVVNLYEDFQNKVVNKFIAEYLKGRTPNPCVACNKYIKFGKLFDFANEIGADYLATGHYAQIKHLNGKYFLCKGLDENKDQSYVLYNLTADQLAKILLPLGDKSKNETRRLAEKLNLPVAHKPDSQEICFVPNDDYKAFILKNADVNENALKPGEIVSIDGKILGQHNGTAFYTIGQRKGLGIAASEPLYVVKLDVKNKQVIVGGANDVFSKTLTADNVHWIYQQNFPFRAKAKIRYGKNISDCTINMIDESKIEVDFDKPQRAVTSGQSIVFYDEDIILGGGIII